MKTISKVQFLGASEWVVREEKIGCPAEELRFGLSRVLAPAWRYEAESACVNSDSAVSELFGRFPAS